MPDINQPGGPASASNDSAAHSSAGHGTGPRDVTLEFPMRMPFSTVNLWGLKRISWVWLGTAVVCIALLAVGAPLNTTLYQMALPVGLGMAILHSASLGLTAARSVPGIILSLIPLLVMPLASHPVGSAPMPFSVVAMVTQVLVICVAGLRSHWTIAAIAWLLSVGVGVVSNYWTMPGHALTEGAQVNVVVFAAVSAGLMVASVVAQQWQHMRTELAAERTVSAEEQSRRRLAEERTRIARELHDVVAHGMSAVVVQATTAPFRHPGLSDELKMEFEGIADNSRRAMTEMRSMLGSLRNAGPGRELGPQPGLSDLPGLLASVRRAGIDVQDPVLDGVDLGAIGEVIALTAYRIVQEALSNVIRHAPGACATISLETVGNRLEVNVVNTPSAVGAVMAQMDPGSHVGQGLVGMRERATIVGGSVFCAPTSNGGFEVSATLPLKVSGRNAQ